MSDLHLTFSAHPDEQPGDDESREARHQVLATLLGAYADGELPVETASHIDAHLLGCARCRREVDVQSTVHARLSREPLPAADAAFRQRIVDRVAETSPPRPLAAPASVLRRTWWRTVGGVVATIAVLVAAAAGYGIRRDAARRVTAAPLVNVAVATVSLLDVVLTDYRRVMRGDLPGRARDLDAVRAAVPFPVAPMSGASMHLLAAWSADLDGEPAAVLVYRWRDQLVFQYVVAEGAFFRHPAIRAPVAAGASIVGRDGLQGLVAWAAPSSGVILVGDVTATELAEFTALRLGDATR